jgi:hypothetical protein
MTPQSALGVLRVHTRCKSVRMNRWKLHLHRLLCFRGSIFGDFEKSKRVSKHNLPSTPWNPPPLLHSSTVRQPRVTDSPREARSLATAAADLTTPTVTRKINVHNELIGGLHAMQGPSLVLPTTSTLAASARRRPRSGRLRGSWISAT